MPPSRSYRLLLGCSLAWLCCCAGELEDPDRFRAALGQGGEAGGDAGEGGAPGGGGEGGEGGSAGPCDAPATVLKEKCSASCHSASLKLGNLDLESPGLIERLEGVKGTTCSSTPLIDPAAPEKSALYDKTAPQPTCGGGTMPQGGPALSDAERACLLSWIKGAAGQ